MNDAAAATFDAVSDGVSDVKDTAGKYVNLDVRFPGNSFHCCFVYMFLLLFFIKTICCVHLLCAHD